MYKKLRRKIAFILIAAISVLYIGTFIVILFSTERAVYAGIQNVLQDYAAVYFNDSDNVNGSDEDSPYYRYRYRIFSATYSGNSLIDYYVGNQSIYPEESVIEICDNIKRLDKEAGFTKTIVYRCEERDEITLVAYMDNSSISAITTYLLQFTLLFLSIAIAMFIAFSFFLSNKVLRPIEENERRQKQFISDAGHELKTPLSVINTNIDLLEREIGTGNKRLSSIKYENGKMSALIADLLTLSRLNKPVPMERLSLSNIVLGEALIFESVAFEKGFSYNYANIDKNVSVNGNEAQLDSLVSILIDNALSHSTGKGNITIELKKSVSKAELSVSNDASNLTQDDTEHMFERFFRSSSAREDSGHYGLGLSIADSIIALHKGKRDARLENGRIMISVLLPLE